MTPPPSTPAPSAPAPTTPVARPEPPRPSTPAPTRPGTAPTPTRRSAPPGLLLVTAILLITTLVFGWMALAPKSAPIKTSGTRAAAAGNVENSIKDLASRFAENLLTYNYTTVDTDFARTLKDATTEFTSRPLTAFGGLNTNQVRAGIKQHKSVSSADVKGVAITSHDDDSATVLVVTSRTLQSDQTAKKTTLLVVQLDIQNTNGGWKVDNATSPTSAGS